MPVIPKRKWLRCNVRLPARLSVLDERNKRVWRGSGSTINLSGGGTMLEVSGISKELTENLVQGKYSLQLALELPTTLWRTRTGAKVTWVEESGGTSRKLAVAFENLPKGKEAKIVDFVEEQISTEVTKHAIKRAFEKQPGNGKKR